MKNIHRDVYVSVYTKTWVFVSDTVKQKVTEDAWKSVYVPNVATIRNFYALSDRITKSV